MADEARVETIVSGGEVTITASGTLTFLNCEELGRGLKQAAADAAGITVDLTCADFIDTQVIQDLGQTAVALMGIGKRLKVIVSKNAYPIRVLRISGYEKIADIEARP